MFKKLGEVFKEYTMGDIIFIFSMILLFIICTIPVDYYITIGGGISDASNRIQVEDGYDSEGSLNISYVTQLDANVLAYLLSFVIPSWERESADLYMYSDDESMDDVQYRSDLDLRTANGIATYWAYTLAGKEVNLVSEKLYVIATWKNEYDTNLEIGDEILSIDGNHYDSVLDYRDYIDTKNVGDTITVRVVRDDLEQDIETKIFENSGYKIMGIALQYVRDYETNPKLSIRFKDDESGPSGGLITTLEIYNQLTRKDITKGKIIAGTGTIEEDGSVGEIGGIEHKILGAVHAKAEVFLSPGGDNYEDAKKYIEEKKLKIQLIQVDSLEDAIHKLEELS